MTSISKYNCGLYCFVWMAVFIQIMVYHFANSIKVVHVDKEHVDLSFDLYGAHDTEDALPAMKSINQHISNDRSEQMQLALATSELKSTMDALGIEFNENMWGVPDTITFTKAKPLGSGQFATSFEAIDSNTDKKVAVKIEVPSSHKGKTSFLNSVTKQLETINALSDCVNVVKTFEVFRLRLKDLPKDQQQAIEAMYPEEKNKEEKDLNVFRLQLNNLPKDQQQAIEAMYPKSGEKKKNGQREWGNADEQKGYYGGETLAVGFVMELVDKGTLEELLMIHSPSVNIEDTVSELQMYKLFLGYSNILKCIEGKGYLHMDIKPANLMMKLANSDVTGVQSTTADYADVSTFTASNIRQEEIQGVIIDLGFTKPIKEVIEECLKKKYQLKRSNAGTKEYMPPQILKGVAEKDCGNSILSWDKYSLGVTLSKIADDYYYKDDYLFPLKKTMKSILWDSDIPPRFKKFFRFPLSPSWDEIIQEIENAIISQLGTATSPLDGS